MTTRLIRRAAVGVACVLSALSIALPAWAQAVGVVTAGTAISLQVAGVGVANIITIVISHFRLVGKVDVNAVEAKKTAEAVKAAATLETEAVKSEAIARAEAVKSETSLEIERVRAKAETDIAEINAKMTLHCRQGDTHNYETATCCEGHRADCAAGRTNERAAFVTPMMQQLEHIAVTQARCVEQLDDIEKRTRENERRLDVARIGIPDRGADLSAVRTGG